MFSTFSFPERFSTSLFSAIIHTGTARRMSTDATHHWQSRHLSCYLALATVPTAMLDRSALLELPNRSRVPRPPVIIFDVYRKVISLKKRTAEWIRGREPRKLMMGRVPAWIVKSNYCEEKIVRLSRAVSKEDSYM